MQYFDPGTQGEHKIARGFEPTRTTSAHWLEHAGFREAVARYLQRERAAVDDYIDAQLIGADAALDHALSKVEDVDMLTLVIVGSSATRAVPRPDGGVWVYTPRGYAAKHKRARP